MCFVNKIKKTASDFGTAIANALTSIALMLDSIQYISVIFKQQQQQLPQVA